MILINQLWQHMLGHKGHNIQNETKLLKQVTNPNDITVWEKLFFKNNESW
jgi:hypothetical protein